MEEEKQEESEGEGGHRPMVGGEVIEQVYEHSLKFVLVAALELYLSVLLVASFFECPTSSCTEDERDEQDLQTLYTFSWPPVAAALMLVYAPTLCGACGARGTCGLGRDKFDRNLVGLKVVMWLLAFVDLVYDEDMVLKRGPGLTVAIMFCAADMGRFVMEMRCLVDDEEEKEEAVDRLANMVISALEENQRETAFKHAIRAVMEENRRNHGRAGALLTPADGESLEADDSILSPIGACTSPGEDREQRSPFQRVDSAVDYGSTAATRPAYYHQPLSRSQYSL